MSQNTRHSTVTEKQCTRQQRHLPLQRHAYMPSPGLSRDQINAPATRPPTFFSSSWQSLTCDSIHRRVKVWLWALCGRGVKQGHRA